MSHGLEGAIARLDEAIAEVEDRDPLGMLDLCALWLDLSDAGVRWAEMVRRVGDDASERILSVLPPEELGEPIETEAGVVHLARKSSGTRWFSDRLLPQLLVELVDRETGEIVPAVPAAVLVEVIPGTASEECKGLGWSKVALRRRLGVAEANCYFADDVPLKDRPWQLRAGGAVAEVRTAGRGDCEQCGSSLDRSAKGVGRLVTAWVANGRSRALVEPQWHERFLCRFCMDARRSGRSWRQGRLFEVPEL